VRRCIYYWKGKQLGRAAEGRAGGARPAGGGGFCESGGWRWGEWAWWAKWAGRLAGRRGSGPRGEKEARPRRWWFGLAGRPRPRERGSWPMAGPRRKRRPKRGGGGSGLTEGQGLGS
jgi:hypothetical protein